MNQKLMGSEEVERLDLWEEHEHRHRVHLRQRGPCGGSPGGWSHTEGNGLGKTGRAQVGREEFRPGSLGSEKPPESVKRKGVH